MRVEIKGTVIPAGFLKIEGRESYVGGKSGKRKKFTRIGGYNHSIRCEAPPRSKRRQEWREKRKCQESSDCQRSDGEELRCRGH